MAQGGPKPTAFYVERQAATRSPATPSPPTVDSQGNYTLSSLCAYGQTDPGAGTTRAGDGLWLTGLKTVEVRLYPLPTFTLTGGSLLAWVWTPWTSVWDRAPDLDLTVAAGTYTGPNGYLCAPMDVHNRPGQLLLYAASSLTGTSASFLVRLDGFTSGLGMSRS
jgi:hypothetical protein